MLAKLSVGSPRLPLSIGLERKGIDEYRLGVLKLDVIGAAVFQGHAEIKRLFLYSKCEERCLFQLAEAPFIGVGNEGNIFRLDNFVYGVRQGMLSSRFLMGYQPPGFAKSTVKAGTYQALVVVLITNVDLAVYRAVMRKNESAWIPKRGGKDSVNRGARHFACAQKTACQQK